MSWHVHPDVILWIGAIQAGYLIALRRVGQPIGRRATRGQLTWFTAGVLVLYVGAGTPIHDLAEQRLFSVHMVQHLLFTLVAAPMLLLGMPDWLLRPLLTRAGIYPVMRLLTRPVVALGWFSLITIATHMPSVMDLTLRHHNVHFVAHVILTLSALLLWWPVFSPLAELPRLSSPLQMVYLFIQSLVPAVLAAFITFSGEPWYRFYAEAPRTWGISAHDDQVIAGLIMKLGGGAVQWLVIAVIFFTWVGREEKKAVAPALRWEDVEDELGRMGLTKSGVGHEA